MAFPSIPHPNPAALALGFGGLLLARAGRRSPAALAGLAVVFRLDLGLAALAGVALAAAAGTGRAPRPGPRPPARRVAVVLTGAGRDRRAGRLLGPDDRLRARRAGAAAAAAARRVGGRVRAQQDPGALLPLRAARRAPRSGSPSRCVGRAARCGSGRRRRWRRPGSLYLLARADVFHLVPLAAVLPVLLATAAAASASGARRWAVALVVVLALIAVQGLDRKRIQVLDPPPLATIDVDVADGVKAPPAEARALTRAGPATCARASRPAARSSSPTRATTWSRSATRSSTCWSGAPTRPATT